MLRIRLFPASKFNLIFVILFFTTILLNNLLFYKGTEQMLESQYAGKSEIIARNLTDSITQYQVSAGYVEELIGQELRMAAIAAQGKLDPDYHKVTNEQLVKLSEELGISHITLFERTNNDLIGVRSSDPKEIGASARNWGIWFKAMKQLYDNKEVTIPQGQKLSHYWAGPLDYSDTNPGSIDKWGYYYDGTTNYMINPFVHDLQIKEFENMVGYEEIVEKTKSKDAAILEITGINAAMFGEKAPLIKHNDGTTFVSLLDRDIYFGHYTWNHPSDVESVRRAIQSNSTVTVTCSVGDRKVLKSFIPFPSQKDMSGKNYPYVVSIVSDYNQIQVHLDHQAKNALYMILLATLMAAFILYLYALYMRRAKESTVQLTQDQYIDDISQMFTTVRGQRHDFLNHVQTIHTMIQIGKFEEVKAYTKQYVEEIVQVNDIIRIKHPVLASQVQSKVAASIPRKITFVHDFKFSDKFPLNALKSIDMVKMIGNLVDNAFDEVEKLPVEERRVELKGWIEDDRLHITVKNPCQSLPPDEKLHRFFQPGFSTKQGDHQGLGLSIVKGIVDMYRGTLNVTREGQEIVFHVAIPAHG